MPLNFDVSCPSFEYGMQRSTTAHKDSRQMFQHSNRMFEQILQILFRSLLVCRLFKQDGRGGLDDHQDLNLSVPELGCFSKPGCKGWDVKREAKRFVPASDLNKLKEKGETRYTFSRGLLSLALLLGLSSS